jgi:hypothetical protein
VSALRGCEVSSVIERAVVSTFNVVCNSFTFGVHNTTYTSECYLICFIKITKYFEELNAKS